MYLPATDNALAFQIKTTDKTIIENKIKRAEALHLYRSAITASVKLAFYYV